VGRACIVCEKEDDLGIGNNKESKIDGNCGKYIA
jgi:hypothetical protein